jgi:hypothetical protein
MKNTVLLLFLFSTVHLYAQTTPENEKQAVIEKINQFFVALEKKDTLLYSSIVFNNAQIWTVRRQKDSIKNNMRSFADDFKGLANRKDVIEERPLHFTVHIHRDIAVAWVPYTLSLSGKFSHCGIDVFTLQKTAGGWKIVSTVYSVEPEGCEEIKKEIRP